MPLSREPDAGLDLRTPGRTKGRKLTEPPRHPSSPTSYKSSDTLPWGNAAASWVPVLVGLLIKMLLELLAKAWDKNTLCF